MLKNSILNYFTLDPGYILLGLMGATLVLFILLIICMLKMKSLNKKYKAFMTGSDAQSLETIIQEEITNIKELQDKNQVNDEQLHKMEKMISGCYQKIGIEKYDALSAMGGQVSFVLVMLNYENSGILMNSIHTREGSYLYLKEITAGKCETTLGKEEQKALDKALALN